MYKLTGEIEFEDGLRLVNPAWSLGTVIDSIPGATVVVNVLFASDHYRHERGMLIYDYTDAGTWEDADLYNALLQLPQLSNSELI